MIRHFLSALSRRLRRPWRMLDARRVLIGDRRGVAMLEFAISLPICLIALLGGTDLAWYFITWQQVAQIASITADNASRIGEDTNNVPVTILETGINDVLAGALMQQDSLNIATNGRIIITSLEQNNNTATPGTAASAGAGAGDGQQIINWQRCTGGLTSYKSSVGVTQNAGVTSDANDANPNVIAGGITPPGSSQPLLAPSGGAIMYVEVAYNYTPMFSTFWYSGSTLIVERVGFLARSARQAHQPVGGTGAPFQPAEPQLAYPTNNLTATSTASANANPAITAVLSTLNTC